MATIICGDFNSCPRGGIYEFMRTGQFDCLKLNKYDISGQNYAMYPITDENPAFCLMSSAMALTAQSQLPDNWNDKDTFGLARWYTEIANTYPNLELDDNLQPVGFQIRPTIPAHSLESESNDYLQKLKVHVQKFLKDNPYGDQDLLKDKER